MSKGKVWEAEKKEYKDEETGARVVRLTGYRGHSNHLYFTTSSFVPGGEEIVFVSDRDNRRNLFLLELKSGKMVQLTDAPGGVPDHHSCLNPVRREAYYFEGKALKAVELDTQKERELYRAPEDRNLHILTPSGDGKLVAFAATKDIGWRTGPQYQGFPKFFEAKPPTDIIVVEVETGEARVAVGEDCWVSHVNFSPKMPDVLCYCHEGPWDLVEQRMWIAKTDGSERYALRPQTEDDSVGHEYWLADGERVAFHNYVGRKKKGREGAVHKVGWIRWDNTGLVELPFADGSSHFQSNSTNSMLVGDGYRHSPYILLWEIKGDVGVARRLARHDSSFHIQRAHPHPIFSPDDGWVLYTSDNLGYCNVHLAEVGESG